MSCQTCYSTLQQNASPYVTPCCQTPICDRCLARNPRLKEYNPCLRCGDVRTADGLGRIERGRAETVRRRREEEEGRFVLGDSDDEDQDDPNRHDKPPSYRSASCSVKSGNSPSRASPDGDVRTAAGTTGIGVSKTSSQDTPEEQELIEVKHPVARNDTVLSIARRYGADPHDLLSLNSLPPTALSSNPRILQTRKVITISRRYMKKGSQPDSLVFDAGRSMPVDPEEEARREEERRVKRFQLITKTVDPGIGRAYLALEGEGDADRHPLEDGGGEIIDASGQSGKKSRPKGKEDRALGAYYEDEAWEREVGGPERIKVDGRWTVVGSSISGLKA